MKSHSGEQVNLLGSCFPVKGMSYERNVVLYAVRCLKSNEDMILTLAGQFKQLSISKQKHPSQFGYFRVRCKNCTFK